MAFIHRLTSSLGGKAFPMGDQGIPSTTKT